MSSHSDSSEKYDVSLGNLGARLDVARTENAANVAVVEHTLSPGALAAPLHRHSREDEISHVLEGEMTVLADGDVTTVSAGESIVKGRDVWHTFWNAGDQPLRFLEIIAPGEFSEYFADVARLGEPNPQDEEWRSAFGALCEQYGLDVDFERTPEILEEYNLRM